MQGQPESQRPSIGRGILLLVAGLPPIALALHALAGPIIAGAACGIYVLALGLTFMAERRDEAPSRNPLSGLPDREAALDRLESIQGQRLVASSQAAVVAIALAPGSDPDPELARPDVFIVAARLAQGLRRGDQIVQVAPDMLAAILGPSRGLTAPAAESILERIEAMFRAPLVVGHQALRVRVTLGACLQHDAPEADAKSWLDAAELAAEVAGETGAPCLFPSGATRVDRSAWVPHGPARPLGSAVEDEGLWLSGGSHHPQAQVRARLPRRA